LISEELAQKIQPGWKKPLPVLLKVNNKPEDWWRINMMPVGDGDFYLYLHGDVRKASGTGVGDTVEIALRFDHDYRNGPMHEMPDFLARALADDAASETNWQLLAPSRQKEVLRYFAQLKSDEAKQRNLLRLMEALSGKPVQFMGRPWRDGR
jgi:hypothetical protein